MYQHEQTGGYARVRVLCLNLWVFFFSFIMTVGGDFVKNEKRPRVSTLDCRLKLVFGRVIFE